jgi:4-hydroxy-2-oxoheptanedioate aldolase
VLQVLVPLIRTVEEVKKLVASCKFPPAGTRGFGSPFAMQNFQPIPTMTEYLKHANDTLVVMVQIETKEALEAVEEIAPLVDVLFIGPFDLGNNIGHPILNGVMKPELKAAMDRVLKAANDAKKKCGIYATSGEQAKAYADSGYHMICCATDASLLQTALADTMEIVLVR